VDFTQDRIRRLIRADVFLDVERDDVRVLAAADPVLGDLGSGDDEHAILIAGAIGFLPDVRKIRVEIVLAHAVRATTERGESTRPCQDIFLHQNVIGNRDHIELAGGSIEVDHLRDCESTVAPPRVHVKITEQKRFVARHQILRSSRRDASSPWGDDGAALT
jgi:hypothetical protein